MASTQSPTKHAHFQANTGPETKRKEKILTIRYGKNQMELIRKRLRVESWLYDELEILSRKSHENEDQQHCQKIENGKTTVESSNADIDIEIDQILDIEGDCERRLWLEDRLKTSKASAETIKMFIDEFLERLKTL